ncbi:MAG: ATP-dependent Clp protease proteolytic subunit [Chitinophagia bacterium]|jgi:ATP-dependent Clp endopeptidase proteolytic subunit ClpP
MDYVRNIDSDEPVMMLDKRIGGGWKEEDGYGIDGSRFAAELMALDGMGKKRIQVWINSVGGSVVDGYNICNAILKTKTKVDTYCAGIAASMAGVIFQCGRKRIMADYGILMYHNPYSADSDDQDNGVLNSMKESLNKIICEKSGMDNQAVGLMMDRTTFINAEEARTMGLCDEIEGTALLNAPRKSIDNGVTAYWLEANKVLNQYFNNQNPQPMKLVANKLGLNGDAAENSILAAVEAVMNQVSEKENTITDLQKQVQEKEKEAQRVADELKAAKDQLEQLQNEKAKAEEATALANAQNMVKGYAAQGRIKNDDVTISAWVNKAKTDMEGVKTMLESLPLNKAAVTIQVEPKAGEVGTSAASLMAKVINQNKKK